MIKGQVKKTRFDFTGLESKRRLNTERFFNSLRLCYILFCTLFVFALHREAQISLTYLGILLFFSLLYSVYRLVRPLPPDHDRHFLANASYPDFIFVGFLLHFTGGIESIFLLSFLLPVLGGLIRLGTNGGALGILIMGIILFVTYFTAPDVYIHFYLYFWATLVNLLFIFGIVAVLVEREETLRKTIDLSSVKDPLTGLYNAAYLRERVNEELSRYHRKGHVFTLMFIDLNGFKKINDTYGHLIGDKVLLHTVKILQKNTREEEILARYGGDEFVLFLPNVTQKQTEELTKRLGQEMKADPFVFSGSDITPGLSIGVATYPENGYTLEELLLIADQQMYEQKRQGRCPSNLTSTKGGRQHQNL